MAAGVPGVSREPSASTGADHRRAGVAAIRIIDARPQHRSVRRRMLQYKTFSPLRRLETAGSVRRSASSRPRLLAAWSDRLSGLEGRWKVDCMSGRLEADGWNWFVIGSRGEGPRSGQAACAIIDIPGRWPLPMLRPRTMEGDLRGTEWDGWAISALHGLRGSAGGLRRRRRRTRIPGAVGSTDRFDEQSAGIGLALLTFDATFEEVPGGRTSILWSPSGKSLPTSDREERLDA